MKKTNFIKKIRLFLHLVKFFREKTGEKRTLTY